MPRKGSIAVEGSKPVLAAVVEGTFGALIETIGARSVLLAVGATVISTITTFSKVVTNIPFSMLLVGFAVLIGGFLLGRSANWLAQKRSIETAPENSAETASAISNTLIVINITGPVLIHL